MSNISIKKDFADGDILPASDLNNNFRVIEAGVNANDEQLEQVIEEAIVRLDNELIEITADRGWDWNGGDRVTFYKGDTDAIEARDIINGQLLYNIETGETAVDDDGERITTGSGNVVAVTETEPENPATKLWIKPGEQLQNVGTEIVNSMSGNETNMAPSVASIKTFITGNTIIDSGSNENGSYIKYYDGTMICWGEASEAKSSSQAGNVYYASYSFVFPVGFIAVPVVMPAVNQPNGVYLAGSGNTAGQTTAGTQVRVIAMASFSNVTFRFQYIAIGRWK